MPTHFQTVIFVHTPKTAGMTLYRILERNYSKKSIYTVWKDGSIDEFKQLSAERQDQIRLLRGHAGYGMHAYLPGPCAYFTLLRDPIKRTISYYHYVRRVPLHYCHDLVNAQQMSLLDFVTSGCDPMADNAHTRLLCGLESGQEVRAGDCTNQMLETAKHNLAQTGRGWPGRGIRCHVDLAETGLRLAEIGLRPAECRGRAHQTPAHLG